MTLLERCFTFIKYPDTKLRMAQHIDQQDADILRELKSNLGILKQEMIAEINLQEQELKDGMELRKHFFTKKTVGKLGVSFITGAGLTYFFGSGDMVSSLASGSGVSLAMGGLQFFNYKKECEKLPARAAITCLNSYINRINVLNILIDVRIQDLSKKGKEEANLAFAC